MDLLLAEENSDWIATAWHERSARSSGVLLIPREPSDLAPHYDITISHPPIHHPAYYCFEHWLAQAASPCGLSCAVLHDGVVHEAIRRLDCGQLGIGLHLDYFSLWHVPDDPYARLVQSVQDSGGRPINPPIRSRLFTDKAACHAELVRHGFGVPQTIFLRPWVADRPLTLSERERLGFDEPGACLFIKPANGFSSCGVVRTDRIDTDSVLSALAACRSQHRQDTILIQRGVRCPWLGCDDGVERPAYWRVLYCLGQLIPFWWSSQHAAPGRPSYRRVTTTELRRHRLQPVLEYVNELAQLTGLSWFSTELCLSDGVESSRHVASTNGQEYPVVAIDYCNDQCDVDVQSRWLGAPPDEVVYYLANRFARELWHQQAGSLRLAA